MCAHCLPTAQNGKYVRCSHDSVARFTISSREPWDVEQRRTRTVYMPRRAGHLVSYDVSTDSGACHTYAALGGYSTSRWQTDSRTVCLAEKLLARTGSITLRTQQRHTYGTMTTNYLCYYAAAHSGRTSYGTPLATHLEISGWVLFAVVIMLERCDGLRWLRDPDDDDPSSRWG